MTRTASFREADLTRAIRALFGRVLRTGLLGKARALFHGLGPLGEYPSRWDFILVIGAILAIRAAR